MQGYVVWMESSPRILKLLLCLGPLDITWVLYRIFRAIINKNYFHLVLAIIWVVIAVAVGWILDLIFVFLAGVPCWFYDD